MEIIQKSMWLIAAVIAFFSLFSEIFFSIFKTKNLFFERKHRLMLIFFAIGLLLLPVTLSYFMHLSYNSPVFLFSREKNTTEIIISLTMPITSIALSIVSQFRYYKRTN